MNVSTKFIGILLTVSICSCNRTPKPTEAPAVRVKIETTEQSMPNKICQYGLKQNRV